jgi:hypothetical protein
MRDKLPELPVGQFRMMGYSLEDMCFYHGGDYADRELAVMEVDKKNRRRNNIWADQYSLYDHAGQLVRSKDDIAGEPCVMP